MANKDAIADHETRLSDAESAIDLLKKMGAPKEDGSAGILDTLNEIQDKLRKEFDAKLADLAKRVEGCEKKDQEQDKILEELKLFDFSQ